MPTWVQSRWLARHDRALEAQAEDVVFAAPLVVVVGRDGTRA
jgi:hypothetical protein